MTCACCDDCPRGACCYVDGSCAYVYCYQCEGVGISWESGVNCPGSGATDVADCLNDNGCTSSTQGPFLSNQASLDDFCPNPSSSTDWCTRGYSSQTPYQSGGSWHYLLVCCGSIVTVGGQTECHESNAMFCDNPCFP